MMQYHDQDSTRSQLLILFTIPLIGIISVWGLYLWVADQIGSHPTIAILLIFMTFISLLLTWLTFSAIRQWQTQIETYKAELIQVQQSSINTQKELEAGRQQALQKVERLQRLENQLPANIHHELRTPIKLIIGFCEAILSPVHTKREPLPPTYQNDIEIINRNALRLQNVIEAMLGAFVSEAVVTRSTRTVSTPARPTNHQIDNYLVVFSEDDHVIDMFKQHVKAYEVIGAKEVKDIKQLAATPAAIIITDEYNYTCIPEIADTVGVQIPVLTCSLGNIRQVTENQHIVDFVVKPITAPVLLASLSRLKQRIENILLIDDNHDHIEMISQMIGTMLQGVQLWKAYSGREGIALMREHPIDIVILDLVLPDMDGLTLIHYLRTEANWTNIPIILSSSHSQDAIFSPPVLGKISIYQLAGFQVLDLIQHLEKMITHFNI